MTMLPFHYKFKNWFNREINYRMWNPYTRKMHYFKPFDSVFYISNGDKCLVNTYKENEVSICGRMKIEDVEIMEYIGLKDKNNNKIYVGDIVKCGITGESYLIQFSRDGNHCYYAGYNTKNRSLETEMEMFNLYELEIVGNVFENPELLKGEQK